MAAQGYIGRAPGESSVVVARQTFTPTGITTNFTFASGYTVGYVDAYLNGARLIEGDDYTATDGSVVGLTTHAQNGDVLELVVYKAFNIGDVTGALNDFSVSNDLTVGGAATVTGAITATGGVVGDVTGDATGLSGTPDLTIRNLTGVAATFTGVLSYDDVTNVDAVGYSTFREGINVQGAGSTTTTLNVSGVTTMTGDVNLGADFNIPDAITHVGDSNTKIRFPAADTFTVETGGSEALRVDSSQRLLVGTSSADSVAGDSNLGLYLRSDAFSKFVCVRTNSDTAGAELRLGKTKASGSASALVSNNDNIGRIRFCAADGTDLNSETARIASFVDGTPGSNDTPGRLTFNTTADGASTPTERLRITSAGNVGINSTSPASILDVTTEASSNSGINFTNIGAAPIIDFKGNNVASAGRIRMNEASGGGVLQFATKTTGGTITEAFRIDNAQRFLIGTDTARANFNDSTIETRLQIEGAGDNDSAALSIISNAGTTNSDKRSGLLVLGRTRGTSNGATTVVVEDDAVGMIEFKGMDGTSFTTAASIKAQVDAAVGTDDMPGRLVFSTTADGAATPTERLRINSLGTFDFTNGALIEEVQVTSGKLSDNTNINLDNGMVYLFTTQETTTSTPNIRINSSNTLDAEMGNGKVISLTIMTTAAAAGYFTTVTIDGNANGQNSYTLNVDWLGGSAPSEGGSSGIDVYNITIIKQSSKNFNILIAKNNYA